MILPLVDFGIVGAAHRFEAWRCGGPWVGAGAEAQRAREVGWRFLRAVGLARDPVPCPVHIGPTGAAIRPDLSSADPIDDTEPNGNTAIDACGLALIERRAIAALGEMFQTIGPRPHIAGLWGPPGSGKSTVVRALARIARIHGFVPVAARFVDSTFADLWRGRSLLVIDDEARRTGWAALMQTASRTPQPHALLIVGTDEPQAVDGVAMERLSVDALAEAVRPAVGDRRTIARIRRAAEESKGLPGRFARLLWPAGRSTARAHACLRATIAGLPRVAEQPVTYGSEAEAAQEPARGAAVLEGDATWPAPGELAALRRRMAGAVRQLEAGRHAAGLRHLREAIGGLARRDDGVDAAAGALALSSALLRRGRVREAQTALEQAQQFASRTGSEATLVDVTVLSGEAWIDLARLDEAETVLTGGLAAAHAVGDAQRVAAASLSLARCLFWRGRYGDAMAALAHASRSTVFEEAPEATRLRRRILMARAAVGLRDFSNAMGLVADTARAASAQPPSCRMAAACGAAFVHLAVGDLEAVGQDVAAAVAASRTAHDPLGAVRARLLLAEAERRRGRTSATSVVRRLTAIGAVPPMLRIRGQLVADLAAAPREAQAIVARHVGATGLGALALYAPYEIDRTSGTAVQDPLAHDVIAILRICQTADDERAVLKEVCGRLRRQLHAGGTACALFTAGRHDTVAGDGARLETEVCERAASAGVTIAPRRINDRIEAAAPVQYGGAIVGTLAARWPLGSTYDLTRAATILSMAAAAVGPVLSALAAHRAHVNPPILSELLGLTPSIHELRRSAHRAAAAPFAVLVQGESGSGKELVARAIHRASVRRDRAFCTLNCAALPDDLVEAELFGHARGSFTGAVADRAGVFEEAHGGTLFLDEVGELSPRAQAKLLRVVQGGELRRVGENISRRVDVRIVSATNRELAQEAAAGRFRIDLLYRLDVVRLVVPPLRERREDIALLADHFWHDATARIGSRATLGATTVAALARYDWPGNVRELQNVLAALAVRSPKRGVVPPTALPPQFAASSADEVWRLDEARRTFEERFVRAALVRSGGHRARAAAELGVTRQGLTKLMNRLGISDDG